MLSGSTGLFGSSGCPLMRIHLLQQVTDRFRPVLETWGSAWPKPGFIPEAWQAERKNAAEAAFYRAVERTVLALVDDLVRRDPRHHCTQRSEERRVGKECVSMRRYRWSRDY